MKKKVNDCLKKWRQAHSSVFFKQYLSLKKAYKKLICKKKRDQNISFNDMLRNADRKKFWKILGFGAKKT